MPQDDPHEILKRIALRLSDMYEEDLTHAEKHIADILVLHQYLRYDEHGVVRKFLKMISS